MNRSARTPTDPGAFYLLLGATLALAGFGLVMVFSASAAAGVIHKGFDGFYYVRRQALWLLGGLVLMLVMSLIDHRRLGRLPAWAWLVSTGSLVLVWVPGLSKTVNGATRWIDLGNVTIQPSEIAKLVVLVCFAQAVAARPHDEPLGLKELGEHLLRWVALPFALVVMQRDLGTAISMVFGPMVIAFVSGIRWRDALAVGAGMAGLVTLLIKVEPYRARRLMAFLDPWADPQNAGYQAIQALYAFGAGGITGLGLGAGRQKFMYLPAAQTDFIFAIIGEELGLIGTVGVAAAFAVFAYAGFRLALKAKDSFGRALAAGLVGGICCQAVLNMAAVTGLAPITGIPLPFISLGGWSLVMTLGGVGLALAVGRPPRREVRRETSDLRRGDGGARVPGDRPGLRAFPSARGA